MDENREKKIKTEVCWVVVRKKSKAMEIVAEAEESFEEIIICSGTQTYLKLSATWVGRNT